MTHHSLCQTKVMHISLDQPLLPTTTPPEDSTPHEHRAGYELTVIDTTLVPPTASRYPTRHVKHLIGLRHTLSVDFVQNSVTSIPSWHMNFKELERVSKGNSKTNLSSILHYTQATFMHDVLFVHLTSTFHMVGGMM